MVVDDGINAKHHLAADFWLGSVLYVHKCVFCSVLGLLVTCCGWI
jgi:hypothetical protein